MERSILVFKLLMGAFSGISAAAAFLVGLVFGLYPALRAARLSPVDAIHRE